MIDTSHIHPMVVHFPVALVMVGLLFEAYGLLIPKDKPRPVCGEVILYLATLAALVAVSSGILFTGNFAGKPLEVRNLHRLMAILSLISLSAASIVYLMRRFAGRRTKGLQLLGIGLYALSAGFVGAAGYLGGTLVYTYMIGI